LVSIAGRRKWIAASFTPQPSELLAFTRRLPAIATLGIAFGCRTHLRIVQSVGPNSRDSSPGLRPAQINWTICLQNLTGYTLRLFAMSDSFFVDTEVSTKTGPILNS
jgi:hypothetical protein